MQKKHHIWLPYQILGGKTVKDKSIHNERRYGLKCWTFVSELGSLLKKTDLCLNVTRIIMPSLKMICHFKLTKTAICFGKMHGWTDLNCRKAWQNVIKHLNVKYRQLLNLITNVNISLIAFLTNNQNDFNWKFGAEEGQWQLFLFKPFSRFTITKCLFRANQLWCDFLCYYLSKWLIFCVKFPKTNVHLEYSLLKMCEVYNRNRLHI